MQLVSKCALGWVRGDWLADAHRVKGWVRE